MSEIPITSSMIPTLNISFISMRFVPKTMVFAAVATGNINPKEAANVAGIINKSGGKFKSFCKAIITGMANMLDDQRLRNEICWSVFDC